MPKQDLRLNITKTKIRALEETHSFRMDSADTEVVKGFADRGSIVNSSGDGSQEIKRRRRLGGTAVEELGKVTGAQMCHKRPRLRSSAPSSSQLLCTGAKGGR